MKAVEERTHAVELRRYRSRSEVWGFTRSFLSAGAAQLELINDPQFANPFYWAAFNLIGDWR
jgi:hypothetical protein